MKEKLQKIRENAIAQIENSDGLAKLNDVRVAVLGKKGELTAVLKSMKEVAPEDRPKVGQWVNETRQEIENKLDEMKKKLEAADAGIAANAESTRMTAAKMEMSFFIALYQPFKKIFIKMKAQKECLLPLLEGLRLQLKRQAHRLNNHDGKDRKAEF